MKSTIGRGRGLARMVNVARLWELAPRIVPRGVLGVLAGAMSIVVQGIERLWSISNSPVALTAVSRNGTIGFDACTSTLANRSRRSFKHL
jgi:hypothetical protein